MKPKDKAQEIGQDILTTGQSNVGRWLLTVMFVAGLVAGIFGTLWFKG